MTRTMPHDLKDGSDEMADIEKTISDLEEQISWIRDNEFHKFPGWGHAVLAMNDALELLKSQQPKTGTWRWKIHGEPTSGGTLGEAVCDQCGESTFATAVKGSLNYCPNCGAKMKKLSAVK